MFFKNLGLKLVALALAIIIYHALTPKETTWQYQDVHDRTFNQY